MHFRASRRVARVGSSGTMISCFGFRTVDPAIRIFIPGWQAEGLVRSLLPAAELTQQALQAEQLFPACIGDRAILEIARSPASQVIAVVSRVLRQEALIGRPTEDVDEVWPVLIDDHGSALARQGINASADQSIALWCEIGHRRRHVSTPGK